MSKRVRRVLIAVAVLLVVLIAADRIGDYVAERAAADTLETSQHLPNRPDVSIAGFPFLTQLASRDFDKITVTASDVPIGQGSRLLTLSRLRVVLHSLTVSRDFNSVHAQTADAAATVTYAELGRALGLDVRYAGDGQIAASRTISVAGQQFTAKLTTRPELANGALAFVGTQISNAGRLGGEAAAALNQVFGVPIPLQGIPFQVQVRALRVTAGGVLIELTGRDLTYSR